MPAGAALGAALGLGFAASLAQTITVTPRAIVTETVAESDVPIWSFGVAGAIPNPADPNVVVNDRLVAVGHEGVNRTFTRVFATVATLVGGTWTWSTPAFMATPACDPNNSTDPNAPCYFHTQDAHVQYDPVSGNFLAVCRMFPGTVQCQADQQHMKLGLATYWPIDPNTCEPNTSAAPFSGGLKVLPADPNRYHRPQLVRGEPGEWYIVFECFGDVPSGYLRSVDSGCNWVSGSVSEATGFLKAAAAPDGRVYAVESGSSLKFHGGEDGELAVNWSVLKDGAHQAITVPLNTSQALRYTALPVGYHAGNFHGMNADNPRLAADPVDPNKVYVVYYDLKNAAGSAPGEDEDVNVYLRVLTKSGGAWSVGARVQVNDDPPISDPPVIADDFQPEIFVTPAADPNDPCIVHVIYYSDRRFPSQLDTRPEHPSYDPNDPNWTNESARFDVYYSYSLNGGQLFDQLDRLLSTKSPGDDGYGDPDADPAAVRYQQMPPVDQVCASGTWVYELRHRFGLDVRRAPNSPDFTLLAVYPSSDQTSSGHKSTATMTRIEWDN